MNQLFIWALFRQNSTQFNINTNWLSSKMFMSIILSAQFHTHIDMEYCSNPFTKPTKLILFFRKL